MADFHGSDTKIRLSDASPCLSRKNSLNLHGNGCTVGILRLALGR
jgi:hypothetical protein